MSLKSQPSFKHVIFDWSGTLYDDHRASFEATKKCIFQLSGHKVSYKEYKEHFVLPVLPFYHRYGIKKPIDEINRIYFGIYAKHFNQGQLFEGVLETLKLLKKQGVSMSVFSTLDQEQLMHLCEVLNLTQYFTDVVGSVCDKRKEFKSHLKTLKTKPQDILYIGDMAHDVEAAHKNKMVSGAMRCGYQNSDKLLAAKPHYLWDHALDWVPFFKSLSRRAPKKKAKDRAVATAGALVLNAKKEVLLVLTPKWGYSYGIPGGKVEKGETVKQACVRELKEETGLNIVVKDLLCMQDAINPPEFYIPDSHFLLFNYLATTKSKKVVLNDEALSYIWVDPRQSLDLNLNQPTRVLIEEYLKHVKNH